MKTFDEAHEDGFGCWEVAQPRRAWELGQGSVDALGTPCRWPQLWGQLSGLSP